MSRVTGDPHTDWFKAMESEHCHRPDSKTVFKTLNYTIETTAANEWAITVLNQANLADMRHGRRLPSIDDLMRSGEAIAAKLWRPEVISVVLYSGPMVRREVKVEMVFRIRDWIDRKVDQNGLKI